MFKKNVMQRAKESAQSDLDAAKRKKKAIKKFVEEYIDEIQRVTGGTEVLLEWLINAGIDINTQTLDLSYSGDKFVLQGIFKALRTLGYQTDKRPEENASDFRSYWRHPESDMRIYLAFSSTVCKRIKVGTKMVEQDVYETVCS